MNKNEDTRKSIRSLLGTLVTESGSFKNHEEQINFIAHGGFGACRCPKCQGKIAVYRKGYGVHKGEPAIKRFTCTCDYSNDSVGFYSALTGLSNGEAFKVLKKRVEGLDAEALEAMKVIQKKAINTMQRETDETIRAIKSHTQWGRKMKSPYLNLLKDRGLDISRLEKDGVLSRIGYIRGMELKSSSGKPYRLSGVVFDKGAGVKIRRTVDSPLSFESSHKFRFVSYGTSAAFGSRNLKKADNVVFVTEGEFDALSIISHGYKAIALSGAYNHKAFDDFAAAEDPDKERTYIISLDNDDAGASMEAALLTHMKDEGYSCFSFNLASTRKDINDLDQHNPGQLTARLQIASTLGRASADGVVDKNELEDLLSSWRMIDELAKQDKSSAISQYSHYSSRLSDITATKIHRSQDVQHTRSMGKN